MRVLTIVWLLVGVATFLASGRCSTAQESGRSTPLHYAAGDNFNRDGAFKLKGFGFDLADVSSVSELSGLPEGVRGLFWVGQCDGVNAAFESVVRPALKQRKLFGFYLMDDPDPSGVWKKRCEPGNLKAESDWIHLHRPDARTFIALMNLSSSKHPSFKNSYTPSNSGVDLFGVSPYPCRSNAKECDFNMIDRFYYAAIESGVPARSIVPIYQTFGCGAWRTDDSGSYLPPSAMELRDMLNRWSRLTPAPVFDYAYSWGSQRGDVSLAALPDLQAVIAAHNRGGAQATRNLVVPGGRAAGTLRDCH